MSARSMLKSLVLKVCTPRMQQRLRRWTLVRQILSGEGSKEAEFRMIRDLVAEGDVTLDIGANAGAYAREMSLGAGRTGRVLAFEPIRETFEILQAVIDKGKLANTTAFNVAMGAESGMTEFLIPDTGDFAGYYLAHFAGEGEEGRRQKTEVWKLDEQMEPLDLARVDFIKCDVEGAEVDVFSGGRELLARTRPACLIEVSRETSDQLFALLGELGYAGYVYTGDGLEPTSGFLDGQHSNYVFLHPDSAIAARARGLVLG